MLRDRIVLPAAFALTQMRAFAARLTDRQQQHLTGFRVLRGLTFDSATTLATTLQATLQDDTCHVRICTDDDRACYQVQVQHHNMPPLPASRLQGAASVSYHPAAAVYEHTLFHGPRLQLLEKISSPLAHGISATFRTPASTDCETAMLDAVLQLAIVYIQQQHDVFSLPAALGSYRLYHKTPPQHGTVTIAATARQHARMLLDAEIVCDTQLIARVDAVEMVLMPKSGEQEFTVRKHA